MGRENCQNFTTCQCKNHCSVEFGPFMQTAYTFDVSRHTFMSLFCRLHTLFMFLATFLWTFFVFLISGSAVLHDLFIVSLTVLNERLYFQPKRCQKLAEHLSFNIDYCGLYLKENSEQTNFISLKKHLPKMSVFLTHRCLYCDGSFNILNFPQKYLT